MCCLPLKATIPIRIDFSLTNELRHYNSFSCCFFSKFSMLKFLRMLCKRIYNSIVQLEQFSMTPNVPITHSYCIAITIIRTILTVNDTCIFHCFEICSSLVDDNYICLRLLYRVHSDVYIFRLFRSNFIKNKETSQIYRISGILTE